MGVIETKIVIAVAWELFKGLFNKKNTGPSPLIENIIEAKTRTEIREAVRDELADIVMKNITFPAETEALIEDLITADSIEAVEKAVERPAVKKTIVESLVSFVQELIGLVFK